MKICMIGLGSIGSRHIKNMAAVLRERKIPYVFDAVRSSSRSLSEEVKNLLHREYHTIEELPEDYDIIFITNPTGYHFHTIKQAVGKTKHMFIEKPLFESLYYDLREIPWKKEGMYYIACPLRYSPMISYVKEHLSREKIYSVRAVSSSYLPDWRAGADYRSVYSAKKEMGGGVSLDLIHEWDYLTHLFGFPRKTVKFSGRYSSLEIDSEDLAVYIGEYPDKLVEIHLDYFGRDAKRILELYCENYVVNLDFVNMTVEYKGSKNRTETLERKDIYVEELNHFLAILERKKENDNDAAHARRVLELSLGDGGNPSYIDRKGELG